MVLRQNSRKGDWKSREHRHEEVWPGCGGDLGVSGCRDPRPVLPTSQFQTRVRPRHWCQGNECMGDLYGPVVGLSIRCNN